jgi:hypothetical protein
VLDFLIVSVKMPTPKANIPKALREQVWISNVGSVFQTKCVVCWCKINVFDFEMGYTIPESKNRRIAQFTTYL